MTLEVEGRPSIAWVAGLPRSWTSESERLVLLVLASDAFEDVSAPGLEALASWAGMHRSSVIAILGRLCEDDERRPALLRRETRSGEPLTGKRYGRERTRYRLLTHLNQPQQSGGAGQLQQSGGAGQFRSTEQSGTAGQFSPSTVAQQSPNSPATPVTPLPLPSSSTTSSRNPHLGARARGPSELNECQTCGRSYVRCRQANNLVGSTGHEFTPRRSKAS